MPKDKTKEECCAKCGVVTIAVPWGMCLIKDCPCHQEKEELCGDCGKPLTDIGCKKPTPALQETREDKIKKGAEDFANRFTGVMKELAEEEAPQECEHNWDTLSFICTKCAKTCPTPKNESWESLRSSFFDELQKNTELIIKNNEKVDVEVEGYTMDTELKETRAKFSNLIAQSRHSTIKEILQKIEGMKSIELVVDEDSVKQNWATAGYYKGYNQSCSDLKQSLEELLK